MRRTSVLIPLLICLTTCVEEDPITGPMLDDGVVQHAIADGSSIGALEGFYFLAPTLPAPPTTGVFDPALSTFVKVVCRSATGPTCPVAFASTTSGAEAVKVDVFEGSYSLNWKAPAELQLGPGTYRVEVLLDPDGGGALGQVLLGYADLHVVGSRAELAEVDAAQYIGAVPGRPLLIKFRVETVLSAQFATVIGQSNVFIAQRDVCGYIWGRTCESLAGDVVADALRFTFATDFALMNAGGIRQPLSCPEVDDPADDCPPHIPPPYLVTHGRLLAAIPFGNLAVTFTLNGAELKQMLETGVWSMPAPHGQFPQVSGLCFTYDLNQPKYSRVLGAVRQAADGSCTGAAIDLSAASSYTIATNDFVAGGGDYYPDFSARATEFDPLDVVVANWIAANTPISPAIQGRSVCTSSGLAVCPTGVM